MKTIYLLSLLSIILKQTSESTQNLLVNDGEPIKIKIDGSGKQKITLRIDDHEIIIPITNPKVKDEKIPSSVQKNLIEQFTMDELLKNQKISPDKNDETQALVAAGIDLEQAKSFTENRETSRILFNYDTFENKIQEYVKKLTEINQDENMEELIKKTRFMEDRITGYLADQRNLCQEDSQTFDLYNGTIKSIQNRVEKLFLKIRSDYVEQKTDFDEYGRTLKGIKKVLKKVK